MTLNACNTILGCQQMSASGIAQKYSALFDRTDKRYFPIYYAVLVDWQAPVNTQAITDFGELVKERDQESVLKAARNVDDKYILQTALLESISTFQSTYVNISIFSQKKFRPKAKALRELPVAELVEASRKGWKRYREDLAFLLAIDQLIQRSRKVSCWLLPLAGLQPHFPTPLTVISEIERIMEPLALADQRTRQAALAIDEFIMQLRAFVGSRCPASGVREAAVTDALVNAAAKPADRIHAQPQKGLISTPESSAPKAQYWYENGLPQRLQDLALALQKCGGEADAFTVKGYLREDPSRLTGRQTRRRWKDWISKYIDRREHGFWRLRTEDETSNPPST